MSGQPMELKGCLVHAESNFNNKHLFMIIHLIDGTYELFRHFYGLRRFNKGQDKPFGAAVGVLNGVLQMIEEGRQRTLGGQQLDVA